MIENSTDNTDKSNPSVKSAGLELKRRVGLFSGVALVVSSSVT